MQQHTPRRKRHAPVGGRVAVQRIACNGMAKMGRMHAYLVGASSLDGELHESHGTLTAKHLPMRHGALSVLPDYGHAPRIPRAASDESL